MSSLHDMLRQREGKTTDGKIDFYDHISQVKGKAHKWLEGIEKNGIDHSKRLEEYLNKLIPDKCRKKLKPAEVFLLLYAVYLHDIGYRNERGEKEADGHPSRSKEYIRNNSDNYLFEKFPRMNPAEPPLAAQAVAEVCYGHAPESTCNLNKINYNFGDSYLCLDTLNLRLVVALLRLADEMDQPYTRLESQETLRENISLVEIGTDIVRWYWKDLGKNAGIDLARQVQKTMETLKTADEYLYAWGLPKRAIVLEPQPPLEDIKPPPEPIDYRQGIPEHYIPSKCHYEKGEDRGLLSEYVSWWLKDPRRKLLAILGEYGVGKSSFCCKFASDLIEQGSNFIPVVVELNTVSKISKKGWREPIEEEVRRRTSGEREKIVLFLDGFDELSTAFDKDKVLEEIDHLSEITQMYQKVVLTCRKPFFKSEEEEKETLVCKMIDVFRIGHRPLRQPRFERIYISLFDDEQIKEYLRLTLGEEKADEFWNHTIQRVFDMKDLAKRPILIDLIVNDIEAIRNIEGKITQTKVYKAITKAWEKREETRIPASVELLRGTEKIPKDIMLFMEELAYWMFTKEKKELHFNTLKDAIDRYFDAETKAKLKASLENLDYQIRNCTFLSNDARGYYFFAHRSFIEYFIARKLYREIPKNIA